MGDYVRAGKEVLLFTRLLLVIYRAWIMGENGGIAASPNTSCKLKILRLGTSPGLRWVLASILVGILVGNVTRGSGSPAKTDR